MFLFKDSYFWPVVPILSNFTCLLNLPSSTTNPMWNDTLVLGKIIGSDQCEMFQQTELCWLFFQTCTRKRAQMRKIAPLKMDVISGDKHSRISCIRMHWWAFTWWQKGLIWSREWGYFLDILKGSRRSWNWLKFNEHL